MNFKRKFELAGENPFITWRKEQGLTRAELARLLDVSYTTVYNLEKGHFSIPLPERLAYKIYRGGLPHELLAEYARWRRGESKEGTAVH